MISQLVLRRQDGHEYPLSASVRLGRTPDNDVVINDPLVSRHHATIRFKHGYYVIRDERSRNGTFVNDKRITREQRLNVGDRVAIGNMSFEVAPAARPSGETMLAPRRATQPRTSVPIVVVAGGGVAAILLLIVLFLGMSAPQKPEYTSVAGLITPLISPTPSAAIDLSPTPMQTSTPTLTPMPTITPTPTWCSECARQQAYSAVVEVIVPFDRWDGDVRGSGSIVSSTGYILTNYHLFRDPDTGQIYNSKGLIFVAINTKDKDGNANINVSPKVAYMAELVDHNTDLDIALIHIVKSIDAFSVPVTADNSMDVDSLLTLLQSASRSGQPVATGQRWPTIPIGDSDAVKAEDPITVLGFPGVGGTTLTITKGYVSGFLPQGTLARAWIKTSTEIDPGNSGGMALNEKSELIGIPTGGMVATDEHGRIIGKISQLRAINATKDLLKKAQ